MVVVVGECKLPRGMSKNRANTRCLMRFRMPHEIRNVYAVVTPHMYSAGQVCGGCVACAKGPFAGGDLHSRRRCQTLKRKPCPSGWRKAVSEIMPTRGGGEVHNNTFI
ncbi:unnamed protein product [Ectocarpus sp. 4 AP-2014]